MEVPVLSNQITNEELVHDSNIYVLDVRTIEPHPENAMFDTDDQEDDELAISISNLGQLQAAIVNRRPDGVLRMVSGHRRREALIRNHIYSMRCEIISVNDDEELVMLFHNNLGRGLKEHYKIRFFKAVNQFLYQLKSGQELSSTYDDDELANTLFVHILQKWGESSTKGWRRWEIIEMITGFSRREQEVLTRACDTKYRESVLASIKNEKHRAKVRKVWEQLEHQAMNGEIPLALLDSEVKALEKKLEEKPTKATKPTKVTMPSPVIAEEQSTYLSDNEVDFIDAYNAKIKKLCKAHKLPFEVPTFRFFFDMTELFNNFNAASEIEDDN
jgi:hypothetical protein